jgi:hypothetical protein
VESLETELASVRETLERTQLDLTQSRKVNEEQAATDAASRAATTAETTRLLERIRQLEEQSWISFLNAFVGGIMGWQSTSRSGRQVEDGQGEGTRRK